MSRQYIYTIERLTKKHGPREVLKNIWLAFYPGAKIGVLGRNGAGKSTLLRIMAGLVIPGVVILDPGCTAKTYPDYFRDLESLKASNPIDARQ